MKHSPESRSTLYYMQHTWFVNIYIQFFHLLDRAHTQGMEIFYWCPDGIFFLFFSHIFVSEKIRF
jgi:hypothetical protein